MMLDRFSKRLGYTEKEIPITIREEAPLELRGCVIQLIYEFKYIPSFLRRVICQVLRVLPDSYNFSEYPNIELEVNQLIETCEWFYIYDIIEAFANNIDQQFREPFQNELNSYFKSHGIGWKLHNGKIEFRGEQSFEVVTENVENVLDTVKLLTAKSEILEALSDLSRRPKADITGAIQHSIACLECVCRETTGDTNLTLGNLIKKYPNIVSHPLNQLISAVWGFSSGKGRHLKEGQEPEYNEAELLVALSAAFSTYLAKKIKNITIIEDKNKIKDYDFDENDCPF